MVSARASIHKCMVSVVAHQAAPRAVIFGFKTRQQYGFKTGRHEGVTCCLCSIGLNHSRSFIKGGCFLCSCVQLLATFCCGLAFEVRAGSIHLRVPSLAAAPANQSLMLIVFDLALPCQLFSMAEHDELRTKRCRRSVS